MPSRGSEEASLTDRTTYDMHAGLVTKPQGLRVVGFRRASQNLKGDNNVT